MSEASKVWTNLIEVELMELRFGVWICVSSAHENTNGDCARAVDNEEIASKIHKIRHQLIFSSVIRLPYSREDAFATIAPISATVLRRPSKLSGFIPIAKTRRALLSTARLAKMNR